MPAELDTNKDNSCQLQNGSSRFPLRPNMPQLGNSKKTSHDNITKTDSRNDWSTVGLVKRYRVEVAASASSVLSTMTTFPLDSVKTRMQTYKYSGFVDCVRHTYQTEKLRGFFRGACPRSSMTHDALAPEKLTFSSRLSLSR
jgi:hypothetical protein